MFERALNQLQQTGADVSEWRLPRSAVGEIDSSEFLAPAKVQAVLAYFTILKGKRLLSGSVPENPVVLPRLVDL